MPHNIISVHMLQAEQGDAFLISCETDTGRTHLLIDGGTKKTYGELHRLLKPMGERGEKLDLLMVTHIDNDHIGGIIELLENNGPAESPQLIPIADVWHNAYLQLQFPKEHQIAEHQRKIAERLIAGGDGTGGDGKGEISARQGSTLGALLYEKKYNWNRCTEGKAIHREVLPVYWLTDDLCLRMLSPTKEGLEKLGKDWLNKLYDQNYVGKPGTDALFDDAYEMMLRRMEEQRKANKRKKQSISHASATWDAYKEETIEEDDGVTNGSSLAFVLEYGKEKRLLYLGDAHPSVIVEGLRYHYADEQPPYTFKAIKVSHHGSSHNTIPELLDVMDADYYALSTNGKYGHPDISTLTRIVDRPGRERTLFFNYETDSAAYMRGQQDKQREQGVHFRTEVTTYFEC